jgi:membrane protease YdiL (CAAX protease family)
MDEMESPPEHLPLVQRAERYWVESRRPLASLAFLLPLLVIYEVGILRFGVRPNGADDFMRRLLDMLGFGQHFLLPGLIVGILLGWHHLSHAPWRLSAGVLSAMAVESIALGLCIRVIPYVQDALIAIGVVEKVKEALAAAVSYLGAGIYEELLFRLILLSLLAWAFRQAGATPRMSMIAAALLNSLLFSLAHHIGPYGEHFHWFAFTFRFLAGMFFSVVYVYRGFGIAAGSHAAYDILVGVF